MEAGMFQRSQLAQTQNVVAHQNGFHQPPNLTQSYDSLHFYNKNSRRKTSHRQLYQEKHDFGLSHGMSMQDVSPGFALRKIINLFESQKLEECSILVNRLSNVTLKTIISELPIELFIDSIPLSFGILESIYSKLFIADPDHLPLGNLKPEHVVTQTVRWLSGMDNHKLLISPNEQQYFFPMMKNILRVIAYVQPELGKRISKRKKAIDKCLVSLGGHGLVETREKKLMQLHDALRAECGKMVHKLKNCMQKLEELSLAHRSPKRSSRHAGPAPVSASHHRMMQVGPSEIQDRLIKNKTLLNVVEPNIQHTYLSALLDILHNRIDSDKAVLFLVSEVRRDMNDLPMQTVVVPIFKQYSHGYSSVLDIFHDVCGDYHDSSEEEDETALITRSMSYIDLIGSSAPVPVHPKETNQSSASNKGENSTNKSGRPLSFQEVSKESTAPTANGSAVSQSIPPSLATTSSASTSATKEVASLKNEVSLLRKELVKCRETISKLQEREKQMRDRLSEQAQKQLEKGSTKFEDLSLGENRPTQLIRRYGNLFSEVRLDAFDALDDLPEIAEFDDLKGRLLFSVVVLGFRSAQKTLSEMRGKLHELLYIPAPDSPDSLIADPLAKEMDDMVAVYLRKTVDKYNVKSNVEEVCTQVYATLYDYPCLKECQGLRNYIDECVKLAWALTVQNPPLVIDFDSKVFKEDMHTRFHSSDPEGNQIKSVLWPALLEGDNGSCVHKGVVIT